MIFANNANNCVLPFPLRSSATSFKILNFLIPPWRCLFKSYCFNFNWKYKVNSLMQPRHPGGAAQRQGDAHLGCTFQSIIYPGVNQLPRVDVQLVKRSVIWCMGRSGTYEEHTRYIPGTYQEQQENGNFRNETFLNRRGFIQDVYLHPGGPACVLRS